MGTLSTFFKESESTLGVFHPKNYIIATFPAYSGASSAYQSLRNVGIAEDEVMLCTGKEMLEYFRNFREDTGLWGDLMRPLSRFIGTEVNNADLNIEQAQEGSGFLAIHCPTEEEALRDAALIKPYNPSSVDWYLWGGIRSFI